MERKTKHRILGILVIIGLVIILLPLFQSNKDLATETALVQAPSFPDQPVQVAAVIAEPAAIDVKQPVKENVVDNTIKASTSGENAPAQVNLFENDKSLKSLKTEDDKILKNNKVSSPSKKTIRSDKHHRSSKSQSIVAVKTPLAHKPLDDDGLIKLKNAAWVIQIGSFKNKVNALRIVNQLRASGYRAFIQQTTTSPGDNIRVFVGPEHKRTTARALADRLQSEMHIQGMVISYKPLTL